MQPPCNTCNDFAIYNDLKKGTRTIHLCLWPSSAAHYYCCKNTPFALQTCVRAVQDQTVRSCAISPPGSLPGCPLQPIAAALGTNFLSTRQACSCSESGTGSTGGDRTPTPASLQSVASVFMEQNCILEVPLLILTQWCPSFWEPLCPGWMQICCRVSMLGKEVSWKVRNRSALT